MITVTGNVEGDGEGKQLQDVTPKENIDKNIVVEKQEKGEKGNDVEADFDKLALEMES